MWEKEQPLGAQARSTAPASYPARSFITESHFQADLVEGGALCSEGGRIPGV